MAGSVFKRGAYWYIRYDLPRGPGGKRREKVKSCKGMTKREAEIELARVLADMSRGTYANSGGITFGDHLNKWLDYSKDRHTPTTQHRYRSMADRHILPALGHILLEKLRAVDLADFSKDLSRKGRTDGQGGLAPKTVRLIMSMIHTALQQAVRWELVYRNVADAVELPRVVRKSVNTAADPSDFQKVLRAAQDSPLRVPVIIAMGTGMRLGEVLGLRWSDFDSRGGRLIVRRSICQLPGKLVEKDTKTGRDRIVMLPQFLVHELDAIKPAEDSDDWICVHNDGRIMTNNAVSHGFRRITSKAGLNLTFHGLRHSQATALILAGVQDKIVSERLGHSTIAITQDIYGHVLPDHQDEAAEIIDALMTAKRPKIRIVEQG